MVGIIRRVTGQESGLAKVMAYAGDAVKWELNESTLKKKFQRFVKCVNILD
jgi:hypothetical protein